MSKRKKFIFALVFLLVVVSTFFSNAVQADIKLNTVLTTNGLDENGRPTKFKNVFNLNKAPAIQYYANWIDDNKSHKVFIEWRGPQGQIINQLKLFNFHGDIVKSYISLEKKVQEQIVVPNQLGEYLINLYIDEELMAVTKFKLKKISD